MGRYVGCKDGSYEMSSLEGRSISKLEQKAVTEENRQAKMVEKWKLYRIIRRTGMLALREVDVQDT